MRKFVIYNLKDMVWTRKYDTPKGNQRRSLTQPETTRKQPFELTEIQYDLIKDKIARTEHVDYNTDIGWKFMNEYDL